MVLTFIYDNCDSPLTKAVRQLFKRGLASTEWQQLAVPDIGAGIKIRAVGQPNILLPLYWPIKDLLLYG